MSREPGTLETVSESPTLAVHTAPKMIVVEWRAAPTVAAIDELGRAMRRVFDASPGRSAVVVLTDASRGAPDGSARDALAAKPELSFQPEPAKLDPKRNYRVALTARQISPLVAVTHLAPQKYVLTELDVASALARSGFTAP